MNVLWRPQDDNESWPQAIAATLVFVLLIVAFPALIVLTYFAMNYPVPS